MAEDAIKTKMVRWNLYTFNKKKCRPKKTFLHKESHGVALIGVLISSKQHRELGPAFQSWREFSYSPTGKITIQIQPDFAEKHGKQTQRDFYWAMKKLLVGTPNPLFILNERLKHVLWKKWVRLVTSLTAFSISLHDTPTSLFLSHWSIKKWTSFTYGGVQGHASHPPPYRPAKTRFSWARKTEHSPKPLFSLKPLDTTTWLRSLLSKVFPIMNTVLSLWLPAWWVFYWEGGGDDCLLPVREVHHFEKT